MQGFSRWIFRIALYDFKLFGLTKLELEKIATDSPEFAEAEARVKDSINMFLNNNGTKSVDYFH